MAAGSYNFTVREQYDGMTVRSFLRRICGLTARSMTMLKSADGAIIRFGESLRSCDILHAGDVLELRLPEDVNDIVPVKGVLEVLFEDDCLLVVNKPPQTPVHPTKAHQLDTLANIVAYHQQSKGERYTFRALNRIDKDTSGCVMIAKDRLSYALTQPTVSKRYLAVCEGVLSESGTIDRPIALAEDSKIRRCVRDDGQPAITHYALLAAGHGHSLIELSLETGRTHQIRCHMSSIGHPLAGDDLYGGSRLLILRQALHCAYLRFKHPVLGEWIDLTAPLAPDIEELKNLCGLI